MSELANEGTVKRKLDIMSCCAIKTASHFPMGAWWRGGGSRGGRPREALPIRRQPLRVGTAEDVRLSQVVSIARQRIP